MSGAGGGTQDLSRLSVMRGRRLREARRKMDAIDWTWILGGNEMLTLYILLFLIIFRF